MELALASAPLAAMAGALVVGGFCVRLSGVYLAMLTLAFAQIAWSVAFQWDDVTGGSNGIVGVWPAPWLASKTAYYWFALALAGTCARRRSRGSLTRRSATRCARAAIRRCAPPPSASTSGRTQWIAFALAGGFAGLAGGLYAFSKGSISPETLANSALGRRARHGAAGRTQRARSAPCSARRPSPGSPTRSRGSPNTGTRCWAPRSCVIVVAAPIGHRRRARRGCWRGGRDERRRSAPSASRSSRRTDEIVRRRRRRPRCVVRRGGRRAGRADRPQRRRQDHLLQPDRRPARARRRHRDARGRARSTACRRAPSRGWASAARSRWPPRSRR